MGNPTLLCVDDEKDNVEALERLFRKKYTVLKATSGQEALQILAEHPEPIAVIITDQRMPEMTGVEFLQQTLNSHPNTLRMLLTGYTDLESVISAVNEGQIYRYLTKPWDPVDLAHTVDLAVERYELGIELREKNEQLTKALSELKTLDHAKSNFMILINHELKTPLTSILNFGSLLNETKLSEEQNQYLQRMLTSTHRLKSLIDDVLLIMKAETNQLRLDTQTLTITGLEGWLTEDLQKQMKQKSITLEEKLTPLEFKADRRILMQIVQRLLHNAVKYGNPGQPIQVSSEKSDRRLVFKIINQGPQIPAHLIEKIFQPFYIDENIMNHSTGHGLGLTICESLLKLHGTRLAVQNLMNGVSVSFEMPLKP